MIALPVKTQRSETALSPLFGHAKYFAFVEDGDVTIEKNPYSGGTEVARWLLDKGVKVVILQHIGRKPFEFLNQNGVACCYIGEGRITISDAIRLFDAGRCERIGSHNIDRFKKHAHHDN